MPLRDHFHKPLLEKRRWQALHALWPTYMIESLNLALPRGYYAEPQVKLSDTFEIDIGTLGRDDISPAGNGTGENATGLWAPTQATLTQETDWPTDDEYEVLVYEEEGIRLVAAIEIVSPSNKDRPDTRKAFIEKCATLIRQGVSVSIVDLVSNRRFNLYRNVLDNLNLDGSDAITDPIYAVSTRSVPRAGKRLVEAWENILKIGQPLPTLPIWLAENLAIPLDLEASYEEACRTIRLD